MTVEQLIEKLLEFPLYRDVNIRAVREVQDRTTGEIPVVVLIK